MPSYFQKLHFFFLLERLGSSIQKTLLTLSICRCNTYTMLHNLPMLSLMGQTPNTRQVFVPVFPPKTATTAQHGRTMGHGSVRLQLPEQPSPRAGDPRVQKGGAAPGLQVTTGSSPYSHLYGSVMNTVVKPKLCFNALTNSHLLKPLSPN